MLVLGVEGPLLVADSAALLLPPSPNARFLPALPHAKSALLVVAVVVLDCAAAAPAIPVGT